MKGKGILVKTIILPDDSEEERIEIDMFAEKYYLYHMAHD